MAPKGPQSPCSGGCCRTSSTEDRPSLERRSDEGEFVYNGEKECLGMVGNGVLLYAFSGHVGSLWALNVLCSLMGGVTHFEFIFL